ncbi:MAG: translation initiation factor IF-3 [Candidatus Daviesbacteria bacterium]|nr:translation initiation factor IF-3 [Candidatus Daviesbacteria bacterium]
MAKYFRVNDRIQARELRVIDANGEQLGVLNRDEALKKAYAQDLDLVEVAPNINPPVAKIVDFEKFRYQEEKKEQAARKHSKDVELKEIWLSPRIAQHDLETRLKKADNFLKRGDKVKLTIKFKGREMAHPETGHQVVNKVLDYFGDRITIERETKFEGRNLTTIVGPRK